MPRYDYRCTVCANEVEVLHGIYEAGPERCEKCGGAMRKALSAPAIHFKGSGWAKKDARSAAAAAQKPAAKSDDGTAKPAASASENGKTGKTAGDSSSNSGDGSTGSSGSDSAGSTSSTTSDVGSDKH